MVVEDDELNSKFKSLIDFIESNHQELSASEVTKMYDQLSNDLNSRKLFK